MKLRKLAARLITLGILGAFFLPRATRRIACNLARQALTAEMPDGRWRDVDWQPFLDLEPNSWFPGRNGIGRHGTLSSVRSHQDVIVEHRKSWYSFHFLRIAVALKGFRASGNQTAKGLDDLVPGWIPEVPRDPASGLPFRHDPEHCILWCAGSDGVDSGSQLPASLEESEFDLAEPTVQLPVPE